MKIPESPSNMSNREKILRGNNLKDLPTDEEFKLLPADPEGFDRGVANFDSWNRETQERLYNFWQAKILVWFEVGRLRLSSAPLFLRKKKECIIEALRNCPEDLKLLDKSLREDRDFILMILRSEKHSGRIVDYLEPKFYSDRLVMSEAIKKVPRVFFAIAPSLKEDPSFLGEALSFSPELYEHLSQDQKRVKELLLKALESASLEKKAFVLHFVDPTLLDDEEIVFQIVSRYGLGLKFASERLKKNRRIVKAAFKHNQEALEFADPALLDDEEFVFEIIKRAGSGFKYVSERLKKDERIVRAAIIQNGAALEFVDLSYRKNREIVLLSIRKSSKKPSLQFADISFRREREIVLMAVKSNYKAIFFADDRFKNDKEIIKAALPQRESCYQVNIKRVLQWVDPSLLDDEDFIIELILQNRFVIDFLTPSALDSERIKEVVYKVRG